MRTGQGGVHGVAVEIESAGEGVQVGQVGVPCLGDPDGEVLGVVVGGSEQGGEGADEAGEGGRLRAGGHEGVEELPLVVFELVGGGEQVAGETAWRDRRPVALDPALGDVAVEQVEAAGVAELSDLLEQAEDRDGRVLLASLAQVVAVGIDEGGTVQRRTDEPFGRR